MISYRKKSVIICSVTVTDIRVVSHFPVIL